MLDAFIRPYINPPLKKTGSFLATHNISPNAMTSVGLGFAALCFIALVMTAYLWALLFFILNRICDGLDGPIAQAYLTQNKSHAQDFGAFYDIVSDFILYAGFPLCFALGAAEHMLAALILVSSFILSGVSFLAYAVIAEKKGLTTDAQGKKGFYYMAGLMEGTETIIFFIAFLLFPQLFSLIAYFFATLCVLTMVGRINIAYKNFK